MFSKVLAVLFLSLSLHLVDSREIPGHRSRSFATAGNVLPALEEFCASGNACITEPVRIGVWNMQRFGISKMNKPTVVEKIVKVVHNYDLIILQEVTDSGGTSVPELLVETNLNLGPEDQYEVIQSPRIGRTSYKEQYVYLYKPRRMQFVKSYLYNDSKDVFQIEPFVVHFNSSDMGNLTDFVLIPLHAKPSDAVKEIDALVDVYDEMLQKWNIEDAIILGDFNAGCSYVTQTKYEEIRLYTEEKFHWLISDHADTTTKTTSCPYDRIVVVGDLIKHATYYKTASVYYWDEELGFEDNYDLVSDISDHYSVGVMIRGTVPTGLTSQSMRVSVEIDVYPNCWSAVFSLVNNLQVTTEGCNSTDQSAVFLPHIVIAEWSKDSLNSAVGFIASLSEDYPQVISNEAVALLGYKLGHKALEDQTLYVPASDPDAVTVTLICRDVVPHCSLTLSAKTDVN